MKNSLKLILLCTTVICAISACSKSDFDYPMETLYGTWNGTAINVDGEWINITKYPYTKFAFSATFYSNGKYYGRGYFGTGSGTYKATGNTIITYVDGEEYLRYKVRSMSNNKAELTMSMTGSSSTIDIRVEKE